MDERHSRDALHRYRGLFYAYGLVPDATGNPTLLSQLTEQVVGRSWFYYVIQGSTLLVLVLAANTSYADFPRLSVILARHDFAPHLFGFRGVSPWHPRAEPLPTLAFTGRSAYTRGRLYEYDCVDTGRPMRYATISPAGPPPGIAT